MRGYGSDVPSRARSLATRGKPCVRHAVRRGRDAPEAGPSGWGSLALATRAKRLDLRGTCPVRALARDARVRSVLQTRMRECAAWVIRGARTVGTYATDDGSLLCALVVVRTDGDARDFR